MNAFVYLNLNKPHYLPTAKKLVKVLSSIKDLNLVFSKEDKAFAKDDKLTINECSFIISIGGDGTLLKASQLALKYNLPIVGINAGRAGFLCKFSVKEILNYKGNPFKEFNISKRDVLSINIDKNKYFALNDIVFSSRNAGYTIETKVDTLNRHIIYHASGVIISTPTGSSAYNASTNGCIIDPELKVNIVSPICPCSHERNSFVINNNETIMISNIRLEDPIDIYCDGSFIGSMSGPLKIKKYSKQLKLVI